MGWFRESKRQITVFLFFSLGGSPQKKTSRIWVCLKIRDLNLRRTESPCNMNEYSPTSGVHLHCWFMFCGFWVVWFCSFSVGGCKFLQFFASPYQGLEGQFTFGFPFNTRGPSPILRGTRVNKTNNFWGQRRPHDQRMSISVSVFRVRTSIPLPTGRGC